MNDSLFNSLTQKAKNMTGYDAPKYVTKTLQSGCTYP
jgi:hypothetical protein